MGYISYIYHVFFIWDDMDYIWVILLVAIMLYTTLVPNHVYTTIWSFFLISKGANMMNVPILGYWVAI